MNSVLVGGNPCFNPETIEIKIGDTILWSWIAGTHTVTAYDKSYDSDLISNMDHKPIFRHTFIEIGIYPYYCRLHGMSGTVIVK
jgi:plastocyanin